MAIDLGDGVPEIARTHATGKINEGLAAAGFDVPTGQLQIPAQFAGCREGRCVHDLGTQMNANALVFASLTRKYDSTIIDMRLVDVDKTDVIATVHEVCDLCGQAELDERIGVAASELRSKAEAALRTRLSGVPGPAPVLAAAHAGRIMVAIIPGISVNLDGSKTDDIGAGLAQAITAELDVDAVGGLEVRRAVPDNLPPDCATTPACVANVGRLTNAQQLLFITVVDSGSLQIDTQWADVSTGKSAPRPAIDLGRAKDIASPTDAKARFAGSVKQLLPDAPVKQAQVAAPPIVEAPAVPAHVTTGVAIWGAVALVGVGVGTGFGLETRSKYNSCDANPNGCSNDTRNTIRTTGIVADAGWLTAIAGAVISGVLFATSGEAPHIVVAPTAGASGTGAVLSTFGHF